jgi:hypothetical protein
VKRRMGGAKRFDALLIATVAAISLLTLAVAGLRPAAGATTLAVIFSPWTSAEMTMARAVAADARFVRYGGFSFIAIVVTERADYASRIAGHGAWLIADPIALAACIDAVSPGRKT